MKNLVTNLELSKKLKELGVIQESYFYWCQKICGSGEEYYVEHSTFPQDRICSAFTASELGEMLPEPYGIWKIKNGFVSGDPCGSEVRKTGDTMADTLARLVIYLLENSLIKL